jgi:hypothetical protein
MRIKLSLTFYGFSDIVNHFGKTLTFCGRTPGQMKPVLSYGCEIQKSLGQADLFFSLNITIQVMTVADVSPRDQDSVPSRF